MQTFVGKRWQITSILQREVRWADKLEEVASICSHSRDLEAVSRASLGCTHLSAGGLQSCPGQLVLRGPHGPQ